MKKTDPPIIVEELYDNSIDEVWKAITDVEKMRKWFFEQIESFEAKEGFETSFILNFEDKRFTHLWKIVEVKLKEKIKYRWRYQEYPGDSFVTFELKSLRNQVKIRLITEVVQDFPQDIPEFKRESCIGGWNYFLKESLKGYLKK
jgi:uncharacterized protein YndB with AHSA1/START domain